MPDERAGNGGQEREPHSQEKRRRRERPRGEGDSTDLRHENGRQQRKIDHLEKQLADARRAGFRQAAPFAKDRPQGRGGRPLVRRFDIDVGTPDETGWRVGGERHWLWVFATPDTTVYAICPGRGFDDALTVLEADFNGVLIRDGWAPYRCLDDALHQTCVAHLLRRCKHLRDDHPDSTWAVQLEAVLQAGLALRDRRDDGELTDHGLASVRGRLLARLARLIDTPPPLDDAERFAAHLDIDATNWSSTSWALVRAKCGGTGGVSPGKAGAPYRLAAKGGTPSGWTVSGLAGAFRPASYRRPLPCQTRGSR